MKPNFIGLGVQKCASSWLHAIFADHPESFVSSPKELDFFSSHYARGFHWYERHFTPAGNVHRAIGEISPSYFPDWDAPARAAAYDPNLRILVALRDPVERAYSNFLHDLRLGYYRSSSPRFEDALLQNPMYLEQSMYARHLRRWMEHFPRERFLFVLQEEIAASPLDQASMVYAFLGIDAKHVPSAATERSNESYLPRSRIREEQVRSIGRLLRGSGLGWIDRMVRQSGALDYYRRANRIEIRAVVPPLSEQTRARLAVELSGDVLQLPALLNRNELPWPTWQASRDLLHGSTSSVA
jgi:hypothetical protein